jgi:hypothetical protein
VIPTVILVGLVTALAAGKRSRLLQLAVVGAVAGVSWGLLVGSEGAFVGGTLLAVPNYAVGVLMGLSVRHLVTSIATATRSVRRRPVG